jgi:hypothetical protein
MVPEAILAAAVPSCTPLTLVQVGQVVEAMNRLLSNEPARSGGSEADDHLVAE